jgi:Protein phosphatase 2C
MFIPKNGDQDREDEKQFVQKSLIRRFMGDHQLLYQDFPAFMEHPQLHDLLGRYRALQEEVHHTFLAAGFGAHTPEISLEAADPDLIAEVMPEIATPAIAEVLEPQSAQVNATVETETAAGDDDEPEEPETEEPPTEMPEPEEPEIESSPEEMPEPELPEIQESPDEMPEPELPEPEEPDTEEPDPSIPEPESPEPDAPDLASPDINPSDLPQDLGGEGAPADEVSPTPMEEKKPIELPVIPVKLNLPNGKIGVDYSQKIDISPLHRAPETLIEVIPSGFEEVGLAFTSTGELRIDGQPADHGKFPVQILLRFAADGDRPAQDYRLQGEIDILPDPRKLWKELEPDASLPYPKAHFRSETLHMAGRTMIAASRRGRSHAHNGTFRDDEFELRVNEGQQWYIMAVADGAGSAPYSRRGSQIACEKAVEILEAKLDAKLTADLEALANVWTREQTDQLRAQIRNRIYEALSHAAYAGYKAITEEAETLGEAAKAFHTTLMLTIVRQFDFGYFVGTWWVGDGAVGILQRGKYLKLMGIPDGGQFAGQTRFLTMQEIWADGATVAKRIEFDVVPDFTGVLLMTDGVSDPKFHTDHNMLQRENWDTLWDDMSERVDFLQDNLQADEQLLDWLDFWAAGEHDDRSIAILF